MLSYKAYARAWIPQGTVVGEGPKTYTSPPIIPRVKDLTHTEPSLPPGMQPDPGPLRLLHGYSWEAMPNARKRTWGGEPVTEATLKKAEEIMRVGKPSSSQHLSLFRAFDRWRSNNPMVRHAPAGQMLAILGAYFVEAGLKCSTSASYIRILMTFLRREVSALPPQWHVADDILKGLDVMAAKESVEHAPDITEERAAALIAVIRCPDVAFTLWAMAMVGGRVADLLRLSWGQFKVSENGRRVAVEFRVTKSSREPNEKYSLCVQASDVEHSRHAVSFDSWIPFQECWRPFLSAAQPFTADVNRVLRVLHEVGDGETTYSFRRLFINRVIDRFTEDGVTMWCKVIEITGHQQPKTAKASYKKSAVERF